MRTIAKRTWGNSVPIKEAADMMIEWCIKAREKNIIAKRPPTLFHAYIVKETPALNYFQPISGIFKYSNKDTPYNDKLRDGLLRCLAVALKAHFFLFQECNVAHEPYFFVLPSLENPSETQLGLIYKIEKSDYSIIVSEKDLSLMYEKGTVNIVHDFNVALITDSFKWYHMKNWAKLKETHKNEKPWVEDEFVKEAKLVKTKEELEKYATILEIPYHLKDKLKPLGVDWSRDVKTWFLPKGYDLDSVLEYRDYLVKIIPKQDKKDKE